MVVEGKVLLLETGGADYGAYLLAHGFVRLLGTDAVRMWPYKWTNEGKTHVYTERVRGSEVLCPKGNGLDYGPYTTGSELWADPRFFRAWDPARVPNADVARDQPAPFVKPLGIPYASDEKVLAMVREGAFRVIVLNGVRWHGSAALAELKKTFGDRLPPVVVCDHEDYPQRRWDFLDAFGTGLYFKRTVLEGGHRHDFLLGRRSTPVRPLPFSSMWDVAWVPWDKRRYDVLCVYGPTHVLREQICREVEGLVSREGKTGLFCVGHPYTHGEWLQLLADSRVVVDHQPIGTDTLRFWEAASAGCAVVSDFHLVTPEPRIDPACHFFQYPHDTAVEDPDVRVSRLLETLREVLSDPAEAERRAKALYDLVRAHHTTQCRARMVLETVA